MTAKKFTPRQQQFVDEYLVDLNATQAAARAGYSARTAEAIGAENLRKPRIAQAIQSAMAARAERTGVTQDRVVQELACLAFFDVRGLFDADGAPLPLHNIGEDMRRAVAGLEVARGGDAGEVLKFKLADKIRALELLGRHLGIFERDNAQTKPTANITGFRMVAYTE